MARGPVHRDYPSATLLDPIRPISLRVRDLGGRALVTGGYVRDRLLGRPNQDLDVEVLGLGAEALDAMLAEFGEVQVFGRAFPVRQVRGVDAQFSLPRRDSLATGGRDEGDPGLSFAEAARRRDLTINALGLDPLTGEILDPLGGRADLEAGVLRAADASRFSDDPLRGLRVMQLAARFEMTPDAELIALCRALDLGGIPGERRLAEFDKLLLRAARPSRGLEVLRDTHLLRFFPELAALVDVPQDPIWHPEGDVWVHNGMALDAASELRQGDASDAALAYGVLCHDFGKPGTTREIDDRITSRGHSREGVEPTRRFLGALRASSALTLQVCALVEHHLAPALLDDGQATPKAFRKLARKLAAADVAPALLERVARADHWGRTTPEALERRFPAGDRFLERMSEVGLLAEPPRDVVRGRDLIARGYAPGPELGPLLERCRRVQDETGLTDPAAILDRVLGS